MPRRPLISVVPQARGNLHEFVSGQLKGAPDEVARLGAELERIEQEDPEFGRRIRDRWQADERVGDVRNTVTGDAANVVQARDINGTVNFYYQG